MHVLIYDPLHGGHHLNWVRLLTDACAPYARKITFATAAQTPTSPEFAQHLQNTPAGFVVDASMPAMEQTGRRFETVILARQMWTGLFNAISRHHPDHVYIPHADVLSLSLLTRIPGTRRLPLDPSQIDGIFLTASFAYEGLALRHRVRNAFELQRIRRLPFSRLLFIDPIIHDWIQAHDPSAARRSLLLPDPVSPVPIYDKQAARRELGVPVDGRWISCVGMLDSRKGVDEFITAFAAAPLAATDRLLLAGRASPSVLSAVASARARIGDGRIFMLDRLLSNREFDLAFSAADLVAVSHRFPDHIGSASILIRAAAAGRPVIASELGWPGHVTRKFSLGTIYPHAPEQRPRAIAESLAAAPSFVMPPEARAFTEFHSVEGFGHLLTAPLRKTVRCNAAPSGEESLPLSLGGESLRGS